MEMATIHIYKTRRFRNFIYLEQGKQEKGCLGTAAISFDSETKK